MPTCMVSALVNAHGRAYAPSLSLENTSAPTVKTRQLHFTFIGNVRDRCHTHDHMCVKIHIRA